MVDLCVDRGLDYCFVSSRTGTDRYWDSLDDGRSLLHHSQFGVLGSISAETTEFRPLVIIIIIIIKFAYKIVVNSKHI